ncbi:MAG: hypothetical protein NTZ51_07715 [Proteobacteria bacterium]|nr:hypothetical protein [Pseudomonadota bacterium]
MNSKKLFPAALILILFIALLVSTASAATIDKQASALLTGLKGVGVVVEDIAPEVERDGLSARQIQADVEQQLRTSGIKVLTEKEFEKSPGMPYLYVNIFTFKDDTGMYAYHITVALKQMVSLVRKPSATLSATTWKASVGGTVGENKLADIRSFVKESVDRFIKDYSAANQK